MKVGRPREDCTHLELVVDQSDHVIHTDNRPPPITEVLRVARPSHRREKHR